MTDLGNDVSIQTIGPFPNGGEWHLSLAHDCPCHRFFWITRGQGRALLDGTRRGIGAHNAVFVPAKALFALELGRQSVGHLVSYPVGTTLRLPEIPCHLRIRDADDQTELSQIIEAGQRDSLAGRPYLNEALDAHGALVSIWLRRQLAGHDHVLSIPDAATRISMNFCAILPSRFRTGEPMSEYARTLGITATHLTRAVKSATGKTAADLLTERVLHEARSLLNQTELPAQNISRYLGFKSAAYFSRFIKQHAGHPPSKLRMS